jgi:hypothetical protein
MIVKAAPRPAGSARKAEPWSLLKLITGWVRAGMPRRIA